MVCKRGLLTAVLLIMAGGFARGDDKDERPGLFGLSPGSAKTICFVCDCTSDGGGVRLDNLRAEIEKTISALDAKCQFNVLFLQDNNTGLRALSDAPLPPVKENIEKCRKFMEATSANGANNPIPALEAAFKQKPDLIYLVTGGDFDNNQNVIKAIDRLNAGRKTKIDTISYIVGNGEPPKEILTEIASKNGGECMIVADK